MWLVSVQGQPVQGQEHKATPAEPLCKIIAFRMVIVTLVSGLLSPHAEELSAAAQ